MPKASVIVPVYNAESTLRRCVESLLFGRERDIEVILVEDHSQDGSWELCRSLEAEYENVIALRGSQNGGVSRARNRGLEAARGEYVLFCDSDDWVKADWSDKLIQAADENPKALVCCGYTKHFAHCKQDTVFAPEETARVEKKDLFALLDKELIHYVWNKCFRLDMIREAGVRFDEGQYMGEDMQFVLDYMQAAGLPDILVLNRPLYCYTQQNPESLTSRWADPKHLEQAVCRIQQIGHIAKNEALCKEQVRQLKDSFVYLIARDRKRTRAQRIADIEAVAGDGKAVRHYWKQRWLFLKERAAGCLGCMKQHIPLWMKVPTAVLLAEAGKWPASVVLAHMRRAFAENGGCGEEGKFRVRQAAHKQTYRYLEKRYGHLVDPNAGYLGSLTENAPVWVFWWQGEENAPLLVQRCIQSLRQHAGSHPIRVVHQDNYRTFVSIPAHIEEKRERGIISLTHFSDILRMALLAEHGGLWLDATIYATGSLEEAFAGDLFTVRNPGQEKENVSRWEWSGYAIGGGEGSDLFRLASDIFSAYWLDHNSMLDYFLIDYTLRLIVDTCPKIRSALESVAPNNRGIYHYQKHFNDPADMLPPENTWLYKLSWKGSYSPVTETGEESLYGRWLRETEEMK